MQGWMLGQQDREKTATGQEHAATTGKGAVRGIALWKYRTTAAYTGSAGYTKYERAYP